MQQRDRRFEVGDELGRGAHGRVVKAWDTKARLWVAIKELSGAGESTDLPLFKQEFRLAREIKHENLVRLHELFVTPESAYFSMELLDGLSLGELNAEHRELDVSSVFGQLADGIQVLHAHGIVHRDVKPSNVFCTREGRVVLLDYGLAISLRVNPQYRDDDSVAGTFTYMAPEVLFGKPPGPASDWYSFGAALAEYLLDTPLFPNTPEAFVQSKMRDIPAEVWQQPKLERSDLVDLCRALLSPDPIKRPTYERICAALDRPARTALGGDDRRTFVGREPQLATLTRAWESAQDQLRCVFIHGVAGIGKSTLAAEFIEHLTPSRDTIILRSKCDPQEAIRFNALEWIDDLAVLLDELDAGQRTLILPDETTALARLFPALAHHCQTDQEREEDDSPDQLKRDAAEQLGFLLTRLSRLRRILIWFDDVQWADRDSFQFLRRVSKFIKAAHIFVLIASRESLDRDAGLASLLEQLNAEPLDLLPLPDQDVRTLCHQSDPTLSDEDLSWLLKHAQGVPFFIMETLRVGRFRTQPEESPSDLNKRLEQWILGLSAELQDILYLVALAEISPSINDLQALTETERPARFAVFELCHRHLLKTEATKEDYVVDIYHDLWREIIRGLVDEQHQAEYHQRLINHYATRQGGNALALYRHYLAVNDSEAAARWALNAGAIALRDLAFAQAVDLFQSALDLGASQQERWRVIERLADALAYDGRSREAVAQYEQAAAATPEGISGFNGVRLLYQAASQCLWGVDHARGIEMLTQIAPMIGIDIPATPRRAMWRSTTQRLLHWNTPVAFTKKQTQPDERTRLKLSVLEDVTLNMSIIDHKKAEALSVDFLQLAIDRGRPTDVVHALCIEAANEANIGGGNAMGKRLRQRAVQLVDKAEVLAEGTNRYDLAHVQCMRCCVNLFLGNYRVSVESGQKGMVFFAQRSSAQGWRIAPTVMYLSMALYHQGDIAGLRTLATARIKGQSPMAILGLGYGAAFLLAVDAATDGMVELVDSMEARLTQDRFTSAHWGLWMTKTNLLLYEGRFEDAWHYIETTWPQLKRELFLELDWIAVVTRYHRSLCALHMIRTTGSAERAAREVLRQDLAALGRSGMPNAQAYAATIRGALAQIEGKNEVAVLERKNAAAQFAACDMWLMRDLARWRTNATPGYQPATPDLAIDDQGNRISERNFVALADAYMP